MVSSGRRPYILAAHLIKRNIKKVSKTHNVKAQKWREAMDSYPSRHTLNQAQNGTTKNEISRWSGYLNLVCDRHRGTRIRIYNLD